MQWAARAGMPCFRGSEDDVLSRYLAAAKGMDADPVVRITSDCPLIDPGIVDQVIGLYRESGADYASNTIDRTYPRGFDAEAVSRAALEEAGRDARQVFEREHVTPYVWQRPERFRLRSLKASGALVRPDIRICVDTPEDLELIRAVFERLGDGAVDADARGIVAVMEKYPELLDINKHVKQKHT
jgi:spore coat polysaccharide biosynthesis protein SpsF